MRRPGIIVTFSSLATAVVGLAVSSGAARLVTATPEPSRSPDPEVASTTAPDVRLEEVPSDGSTPRVRTEVAIQPMPEILLDPKTAAKPLEPVARQTIDGAPATMEVSGRRRPDVIGIATEGGLLVGDDHAPRLGEVRYFNGRPIRAVRTMRMRVTAYSPDHRSCGIHADGITASGYSVDVNGGRLVAADRRLFPFGALVSVPGYASGQVVPVLDRGGAIKGSRLDVLYPTHEIARQWGVQHIDVMVWEYADGEPIGFKRPRGR